MEITLALLKAQLSTIAESWIKFSENSAISKGQQF
jgi:hypothetical protein